MKMLTRLVCLLALILIADQALAASRFWVGGTGTWDASDTTHWSATTGGGGGASVPGASDTTTFDAMSGGGTVTVNTTVGVQSLTCGAFTGTLDFSANNNNVTLSASASFNCSGTGTRTLNLGNGTWTVQGATGTVWTIATTTNLTFNANSSTIVFSSSAGNPHTFSLGSGLTYNVITITGAGANGAYTLSGSASTVIGTLNLGIGDYLFSSLTITNAPSWTGTSANPILLESNTFGSQSTLTISSGDTALNWVGIRSLEFLGGTNTAINAFNFGQNAGITITPPSGGFVVGG